MELNPLFLTVYGALQAGLVMPLVQWLKSKLPGTFPVQPVLYTAALSFGVAWLLSTWLQPGIPIEQIAAYALGGQFVSQTTHATVKSLRG